MTRKMKENEKLKEIFLSVLSLSWNLCYSSASYVNGNLYRDRLITYAANLDKDFQ